MAELYFVLKPQTVAYTGLLNVHELYMQIDSWFRDKGYEKNEIKNEEAVAKEGKYIELHLEPWKKVTDYLKFVIRLKLKIFDCKEVEVELDGHKTGMHEGRVQASIEAWLLTDYEDRFDQRPLHYFLRTIYDKFFFRTYTQKYSGELKQDALALINELKSFLNLYSHRVKR